MPLAIRMSGSIILRHLVKEKAALALDPAVQALLDLGKTAIRDLGGTATTRETADAITELLNRT